MLTCVEPYLVHPVRPARVAAVLHHDDHWRVRADQGGHGLPGQDRPVVQHHTQHAVVQDAVPVYVEPSTFRVIVFEITDLRH